MRKVVMIFTVMLVTMSAFNALSQEVILQPGEKIKFMNRVGKNYSWIGAPLENDGLPDLKFATSNGFMHLNGYGKLGIGIMNPFGKLEVAGMTYFRGAPTVNTISEQVRFGREDSNIRYHSIYTKHTTGGNLNFMQFRIHDGVTSATAQRTVMTLLGDGNVGIGTTNPARKLEVNGDVLIGGSNAVLILQSGSSVWDFSPKANGLAFNQTGVQTSMFFEKGGNVGIGTTKTNGYKLAVDGTIGAREIVVNTEAWADFVFAKNYRLMPLSEVESFITENNHLPDVPSEQEVKENGINVAEMNAKLLQKIEELTLYVIEQNKRISELEKQVKENK
ncbi:MAG: hypothetical protein N4A72_07830 [Bacteroidales bacterium]|nr:hypothetical protein [Bacteroidales bacterium]